MFERFVDIICNYVEVEASDVQMDSRFIEDLGFTSFDFMTMLGDLEDEFEIEVPDEDAEKFQCVSDLVKYIEEKIN